jgi:hypothetical protein
MVADLGARWRRGGSVVWTNHGDFELGVSPRPRGTWRVVQTINCLDPLEATFWCALANRPNDALLTEGLFSPLRKQRVFFRRFAA